MQAQRDVTARMRVSFRVGKAATVPLIRHGRGFFSSWHGVLPLHVWRHVLLIALTIRVATEKKTIVCAEVVSRLTGHSPGALRFLLAAPS